MDWCKLVIGWFAAVILVGCAQVGQISGGEQDKTAPKPIESGSTPPNETTFFSGKEVRLTFDEFVQLNSPQQTMTIVPKHANLKARITKKTLVINWEEDLEPNTTYVISLNGTVKDVAEGNDSLLQVVFSTGAVVDSLSFKGKVNNGFTNKPEKDLTVGLFTLGDSLEPIYFTKTQADGAFTFNYLKSGVYTVFAFEDKNSDGKRQLVERLAFRNEQLQLDSAVVDSIPLRLFEPQQKPQLRNAKFNSPGSVLVGSTVPLENVSFSVNGKPISEDKHTLIKKDSIQLFYPVSNESELEIVADGGEWKDTLTLRITEKEKLAKLKVKPLAMTTGVGPHEQLAFQVTDLIQSIDTSAIKCIDITTKNSIPFTFSYKKDTVVFTLDRSGKKSIKWQFGQAAFKGEAGTINDSVSYTIPLKIAREYGNLLVKTSGFPTYTKFELLKENKIVREIVNNVSGELRVDFLDPGEYTIRAIDDANKNGSWDTGNVVLRIQPETVRYFTNPIRIRSNWDVEVELVATP